MAVPTLFLIFAALLAAGCPIAAALGFSAACVALAFGLAPLDLIPHLLLSAIHSFTLLPIPLFILAGGLLAATRLSRDLILAAQRLFGRSRSGLAYVMITGSIFLAGISGSGPADTAVLASLMTGSMVQRGYGRPFVAALAAACGAIGIIVPPSIALIIYGVVAETDISALFLAGVLPGFLVGAALAVGTRLSLRRVIDPGRQDAAPGAPEPRCESSRRGALWGAGFPLIILGGIYTGLFTPTESAAVAVAYALVVGRFVLGELDGETLRRVFAEAARTSAAVMSIVACASLFAWIITVEGVAGSAAAALGPISHQRWAVLLLANFVLLAAGCFMDAISVFYVFVPLLLPAVRQAGIDPVHFGIIATVNLAVGQVTPPIGVNLFVASGITGVPLAGVVRAGWPLLVALLAALALVSAVPQLSLLLPALARA